MTELETFENIRLFLPKYLSPARQDALWQDLKRFPDNRNLYSEEIAEPDILQGDGWRGFIVIDFRSAFRKTVSGLVLSNSCDISAANRRVLTPNVTFVPLLRMRRYVELLDEAGQTEDQRTAVVDTIRRQRVTSLMYLPGISGVIDDSVAMFGDVHSHPINDFRSSERARLFRLSDFGFYLLLFKLSIHFSRMLEDVER